jgi:competence protein ComEC
VPETGTASPTVLAPLPVPTANASLARIRKTRRLKPAISATAFVPLFYAALLYLAGIVFVHFQYLRPSLLLAGLLPLTLVAIWTIAKAPRLTWLPFAAIWLTLGAWSAETEPQPAPDPAIAQLADGLLRTVEGTVADAGPMRVERAENQDFDSPEAEAAPTRLNHPSQRVDLQLTAAEVVNNTEDRIIPIPSHATGRIRLTIEWPGGHAQPIPCGQHLRAVVRILPAETFSDPGVWDRTAYLESQQIAATATVNANKLEGMEPRVAILEQTDSFSMACLLNRWRNAASDRLQTLPSLTHSLPSAPARHAGRRGHARRAAHRRPHLPHAQSPREL